VDGKKEAVLEELEILGSSKITDVLSWDQTGGVSVIPSYDLPEHTRKAIKKIKIRPTKDGNEIEVEMHDKMSALRLLSKHYGLLENLSDDARPTIMGINLKGPVVTNYTITESPLDEEANEEEAIAEIV
jgi:hypothetical protein